MKKISYMICALLLSLLVGCGVSEGDDPDYSPNDRAQANHKNWAFVETEEGCYYQSDTMVYFIPRGSDSAYPLCGKPNCTHEDESCNAYCGWGYGYYNGLLYYITPSENYDSIELVRMNLDGSNHTVVSHYEPQECFQFYFHHGMLLMIISGNDAPLLEDRKDRFLVIDLSDYSCREVFSEYFAEGKRMEIMHFSGYRIYGYSDSYQNSGENCCLMEWNIETGESRVLLDQLIATGYATESSYYYVEPAAGFRELNLTTGEVVRRGTPMEDAWWMSADEEFIYVVGFGRQNGTEYTLSFYSHDYELLDQVEMKNDIYYGYVSSDRLYFVNNADEVYCPIAYYIDKADIGSGRLELKPFND